MARARQTWPARTVHVECDHLSQVERALAAGADALLLDNMSTDEVRQCVEATDRHVAAHGGHRPLLEVSGNVTLQTVGGLRGDRRRLHLVECTDTERARTRHRP